MCREGSPRCLVFGCGNPLLGDDGFGPQVIERLTADHALPPWVGALDVGTAIRDILFDLLLVPQKPERLIVVDAMDHTGRPAGEILEISVDGISPA
ncbi:MAG: hydrogenase maturation protease, partial [Desulfobacterales bacterium]